MLTADMKLYPGTRTDDKGFRGGTVTVEKTSDGKLLLKYDMLMGAQNDKDITTGGLHIHTGQFF